MAGTKQAKKSSSNGKCVSDGCGHPRDEHSSEGRTCWGATTCPCRGYASSSEEAEAIAAGDPAVNEPIPGGPDVVAPGLDDSSS